MINMQVTLTKEAEVCGCTCNYNNKRKVSPDFEKVYGKG